MIRLSYEGILFTWGCTSLFLIIMSTNCFSTLLDNLVCIDVCLVNCCFWSFVSRFNRLFERLSVTVVLYNIFESGQRCLVRVMCAKLGLFRKTFFLVTLCNCSSSFFKRSSCSRIILLFSSTTPSAKHEQTDYSESLLSISVAREATDFTQTLQYLRCQQTAVRTRTETVGTQFQQKSNK